MGFIHFKRHFKCDWESLRYSALLVGTLAVFSILFPGTHAETDSEGAAEVPSASASETKLDAKRTIKLSATLANNLADGMLVGGLVGPSAAGKDIEPLWYSSLILLATALHLIGRMMLWWMKSKD